MATLTIRNLDQAASPDCADGNRQQPIRLRGEVKTEGRSPFHRQAGKV
jgi:hypothetical protein